MKLKTDIYNRQWRLADKKLCPTCGQPDSTGNCKHAKLRNKDVIELRGKIPKKPFMHDINIYQNAISHDRKHSFWYDGQIASITVPKGTYYLIAFGDVAALFEKNGKWYRNSDAVTKAIKLNYTDNNFKYVILSDIWKTINWFEIIFVDMKTSKVIYDLFATEDNYTKGIELLKNYVIEKKIIT